MGQENAVHYKGLLQVRGMGGVWGKGYCRTVRLLAGGYRHRPGFPAAFAAEAG